MKVIVPEDRRIFADLTIWENLDVASRAAGRSPGAPEVGHPRPEPGSRPPLQWSVERVFNLFPKLAELTGGQGSFLSGGAEMK